MMLVRLKVIVHKLIWENKMNENCLTRTESYTKERDRVGHQSIQLKTQVKMICLCTEKRHVQFFENSSKP